MREIKFRIWDHKLGGWVEGPILTGKGTLYLSRDAYIDDMSIFDLNEKISFMQYTGLKDKNGKEIYEGDILLADKDYCDGNYELKLLVKWDEVVAGYYLYDTIAEDGADNDEFSVLNNCYAVIGNIYETPELLNV